MNRSLGPVYLSPAGRGEFRRGTNSPRSHRGLNGRSRAHRCQCRQASPQDRLYRPDEDQKARKPLTDGVLTFPFFAIENVDRIDATHIIVGNDNNLPCSSSRDPNKADDNEFVLLEVGDFLKAK